MFNRAIEDLFITQIKETFYTGLLNQLIDRDDVTAENLAVAIKQEIKVVALNIINLSPSGKPIICLPTGPQITSDTCPLMYMGFFQNLLRIKEKREQLHELGFDFIIDCVRGDQNILEIESSLNVLADALLNDNNIRIMIQQLRAFVAEAKGFASAPAGLQPARAVVRSPVTPQLIRDSFYNEMVTQAFEAIENRMISFTDFEDADSSLFFALPALTLIEAINLSRDCDGIRLLGDVVLTADNCPQEEGFDALFKPVFELKSKMSQLSNERLTVLKYMCLMSETPIPSELQSHKASVVPIATVINEIASQISRRGVFKQTVLNVIGMCLESLRAQAPKPS